MTEILHAAAIDLPQELQGQIKRAFDRVRGYITSKGNERLKSLMQEWSPRFKELFESTKRNPEVAISLVGGTGAGKSTLLNAIIGARVLPVSNMRACTAAICEVAYGHGHYSARVEFVSRNSWQQEIDHLIEDIKDSKVDSKVDSQEEPGGLDIPIQISRAARDKLKAVYHQNDTTEVDPFNLQEPEEIRMALDQGFAEFSSPELGEFRRQIARYLDSGHRFWPIVKSVSLRGPFPHLLDGAKIVDLPGINDPNEAREEVTKRHLKTCRFVWLVFNIKRALTRDTIHLMQSDDFLRQIVMDGRADSLTFVGSAADDVDLESGIEEFRLPENSSIINVVSARNLAVRDVVYGQLDDLANRLGELAGEDRSIASQLGKRLRSSKIFTVSSREFLRLSGLANTMSSGFEDVSQTEIPALVAHMRNICAAYGISAHCDSIKRQLHLLFDEIKREIQTHQSQLNSRVEVSERGREEVRAAIHTAQTFLDTQVDSSREILVQALESDQAILAERVKLAVEKAKQELQSTIVRWNRMHWASIKAACRRGGAHKGSTGAIDFSADLSKPILDGIAFAWSEFFGDKLTTTLDRWVERLFDNVEKYRFKLKESLPKSVEITESFHDSLANILDTTKKVLREHLNQAKTGMRGRIEEVQRNLYESVPEHVRDNMQRAFDTAAQEKGTGMKLRMVDTLGDHARQVAQVMFDDAKESIITGVRGLNDSIVREYDKMIDSVRRGAAMVESNLVSGDQHRSIQSINAELATWNEFSEILLEIRHAA